MGTSRRLDRRPIVEPARGALARLAEGHDLVGYEVRVVCADGAVRWLEWNTRSMPERGVLYGVARDTTERRRIEAELREAQGLLEIESPAGGGTLVAATLPLSAG